jgi:hypothetical protein
MMDLLFIGVAHAANGVPDVPGSVCSGLIGCGLGASNVVLMAIPKLAMLMLQFAGGAAVLFVMWAGGQMLVSMGDESKVTQGKWGILYALVGLAIAILSQSLISVVGTQNYTGAGANFSIQLLSGAAGIIRTMVNAVLLIVILLGGVRMLYSQGKQDEYNKGKTMMQWALIGAVVVNLANALVQVVTGFFGV